MALDTIISAVAGVLQGVSGIGKVVTYYRYTFNEAERNELYASNKVLAPWIITRESSTARDRGAGFDNIRDQHAIAIFGYLAVTAGSDSEKKHQAMAEAVRLALRANRKLPAGVGWLSTPPSVAEFGQAMFAQAVLCWRVKITFTAEEVVIGG